MRGPKSPLTCRDCRHFIDDPDELERELPGLTALSSARGSARGDSGICAPRKTFQRPIPACPDFEERRRAPVRLSPAPRPRTE